MGSQRDGMATVSIYLLVLGLPLASSPTASDSFMPVRLVILGVGLALGLVAPGWGRLPRAVMVALAAGLGVFVAAALAGQTPLLSLVGRYPRYEGLPVVLGYAAVLLVGARLLGQDASRLRRQVLNALVIASIANALVAAVQLVTTPDARVTGTLGNSTALATFSLITLAMVGTQITSWNWWRWAGVVAGLFCLTVSASRGAMLGAIIAAAALTGVRLAARRPGRWWWGPAAALCVLGLAVLAPGSRARITGTTPFAEATVNGRLLLWQETVELIASHPILGAGPSRFVDSIGAFHSTTWAAQVGPYAPPDTPHNVILQVASSAGWLGLAAMVAIIASTAWTLWQSRPWDAWQVGALLTTVAVAASYFTSFTDPVTLTVAALVVGGAVASSRDRPAAWRRPAELVGAAAALVLGVALGGSALVAEARYSAAVQASGDTTRSLLSVPGVRPWDADLARRVGYTAARLAERGRAAPGEFIAPLHATCAQLPGSVECLQALADVQDLAGEHEAALETLDRATAADPDNVDTVLRRGIALSELGRYPEAISQFQRAQTLRPSAPEPWDDLAKAYDQVGRSADAAAARAQADVLRRR